MPGSFQSMLSFALPPICSGPARLIYPPAGPNLLYYVNQRSPGGAVAPVGLLIRPGCNLSLLPFLVVKQRPGYVPGLAGIQQPGPAVARRGYVARPGLVAGHITPLGRHR